MSIIDRRQDPGGKSLANRQRFLRRARAQVRRAVRDASSGRSIKDVARGGEIVVPANDVHEPVLRPGQHGGDREYVLPGNKDYVAGDRLPKPDGGEGEGGPSDSGEGEDDFSFVLSREEFLELFLEDLELPDLAKRQVMGFEEPIPQRAGFQSTGSPSALSITRTMRNSLSRRIALRRPSRDDVAKLEEELAEAKARNVPSDVIDSLQEKLERQTKRLKLVPFIDPLDVRYRRFEQVPQPVAKAVMFCLMDVSGSMDEHMKDLAKRFYSLLYLFLNTRYKRVEVVFIRHTHVAREVDEDTFFHSRESGGTVVSTVLEEMARIISDRYPPNQWNIYGAQASDGDNLPMDNPRTVELLTETILPQCQYFSYLEVCHSLRHRRETEPEVTSLWRAYEYVADIVPQLAMRRVGHRREIYPVFRELFAKKNDAASAGGEG